MYRKPYFMPTQMGFRLAIDSDLWLGVLHQLNDAAVSHGEPDQFEFGTGLGVGYHISTVHIAGVDKQDLQQIFDCEIADDLGGIANMSMEI